MTPADRFRQDRDVYNLATATATAPSQHNITRLQARRLGISDEKRVADLNWALAYAYAQGYIRGRDLGRRREVRLPEEPTPGPQS